MTPLLERLLLFFVPFALYFGWAAFVRRRRAESGGLFDDAPYTKMILAGMALVVLSFVLLRLTEPQPDKHSYVPPHLDAQGNIIGPAHTP